MDAEPIIVRDHFEWALVATVQDDFAPNFARRLMVTSGMIIGTDETRMHLAPTTLEDGWYTAEREPCEAPMEADRVERMLEDFFRTPAPTRPDNLAGRIHALRRARKTAVPLLREAQPLDGSWHHVLVDEMEDVMRGRREKGEKPWIGFQRFPRFDEDVLGVRWLWPSTGREVFLRTTVIDQGG
ncbi:hypothetical protein [Thioalkalivibrio sp. ALE19]|uniref:hypothetical protein n=1 Tax=Thioalkalivibrio sp. ALE19 TaxID=1266909 RepID=UPI0004197007|nr:hypothetical protein [Thioalkalivibrio sp. ALE19]